MAKLCQILALLTGKKTAATQVITSVYHKLQKPELFSGMTKRYRSLDEDGESFPDEVQNVKQSVNDCLAEMRSALSGLVDLVAMQDKANTVARADVTVDNVVILSGVPVTHLLFLEKQLTDLRTMLSSIPALDPQEKWSYDTNAAAYISAPAETNKTKKVPRTHVKYEATPEHPAQTELYYEDIVIGRWTTIKFSAALPSQQKQVLLSRVDKLRDAVKLAREEANLVEAPVVKYGEALFAFIFGK